MIKLDYSGILQQWQNLTFAEYSQQHKSLIRSIRQRRGIDASDATVDYNCPFYRHPNGVVQDNAVLLIHGFLASPYYMRALAKEYEQAGFSVYALTLVGHGTYPNDLWNTGAQDWWQQVTQTIEMLQKDHKAVHLCGFSIGATLSCLAARYYDLASIAQMVPAFAIAVRYQIGLALTYPINSLHRLSRRWQKKPEASHKITYLSAPVSACYAPYSLIRQCQRAFRKATLNIPSFMVATAEDATINGMTSLWFFKRIVAKPNVLLWYQRSSRKIDLDGVITRYSNRLADDIEAISHIGVTIKEDDPYLGRNGKIHKSKPSVWGELGTEAEKLPGFKRLTFNPDFALMASKLHEFIDQVRK